MSHPLIDMKTGRRVDIPGYSFGPRTETPDSAGNPVDSTKKYKV